MLPALVKKKNLISKSQLCQLQESIHFALFDAENFDKYGEMELQLFLSCDFLKCDGL